MMVVSAAWRRKQARPLGSGQARENIPQVTGAQMGLLAADVRIERGRKIFCMPIAPGTQGPYLRQNMPVHAVVRMERIVR